jgi:uroporphyrinogen decarboxylase
MWASSDVDGVALVDGFASQVGLLIPAAEWRDLVKPLYQEYCRILHEKDKFAFFRCPGNIGQVFGDLVEVGIDAINCELFLMNIEALAKHFRGKIAFWGTVHPEQVLTSGKPADIHAAVHRIRRALDFGSGGLIAQCTWEPPMPFKNVAAALEAWLEPMLVHA